MQVGLTLEQTNSKESLVVHKKINSGKFNVYHARFASRDTECALKVFPKNTLTKRIYSQEKSVISKLRHSNIISYIPVKDHTLDCNILLTEYAPYGNFFNIVSKGLISNEKLVRTYFHQLMEALEYIHFKGFAHLDLKLENFLLDKNFQLKVADFDQAQPILDPEIMSGGTPNYRAPEMISGTCKNPSAADIYAAGIVLFVLQTGEFPFVEEERNVNSKKSYHYLFYKDNQAFWEEKHRNQENLSPAFIEIINGMLRKDASERFTIGDIKKSKWYNDMILDSKSLKIKMERSFENTFTNYSKVKSLINFA